MRDLRVYAEALDGSVSHFRDKNGLECDAVVHRRDGRYGLIETKLGSEKDIDDGVKALKTLSRKIDTDAMLPETHITVEVNGSAKPAPAKKAAKRSPLSMPFS